MNTKKFINIQHIFRERRFMDTKKSLLTSSVYLEIEDK